MGPIPQPEIKPASPALEADSWAWGSSYKATFVVDGGLPSMGYTLSRTLAAVNSTCSVIIAESGPHHAVHLLISLFL